jgi:nucleoside 2-deoxyribosyltransferase
LFSEAERSYNAALAELLTYHLFDVYVPQDIGDNSHTRDHAEHQHIYESNMNGLHQADAVVAVIEGADVDSGTAWEMGYAAALNKPVFALRTDFRRVGLHEHVNLMLEQSAIVVKSRDELLVHLKSPLVVNNKGY